MSTTPAMNQDALPQAAKTAVSGAAHGSAPLAVAEVNHLWWGVCIGGRHYTGDIRHGRPRTKVEMIRKLSAREAKDHAEREGRMWLARERETNKFDTLKQLERHAARWCADNLGEQWVLLYDEGNPSIVIAGKGWIVTRIKTMNKLAKAWDKVPNSRRDFNHPSIKQLYRAWNTLLQEHNAEVSDGDEPPQKDAKHFETACERVANELAQGVLLPPNAPLQRRADGNLSTTEPTP